MIISIFPYTFIYQDQGDFTRIENWTRINKEDRLVLESLDWVDGEGSIRINDDGRVQTLKHPISPLKPTIVQLKALKELEELDLSYSELPTFVHLPKEIGDLSNLIKLNLAHTDINLLPDEIGNLRNLVKLNLSYTIIKYLPSSIGNLSNLVRLDLGYTKIKCLPCSIGKLTALEKLILVECEQLKNLPEAIWNLGKLKVLKSHGSPIANKPSIEYALACNRYRSRMVTSPKGYVWALILRNAWLAFNKVDEDDDDDDDDDVDLDDLIFGNNIHVDDDFFGRIEEEAEVETHDAIYLVLVDHGPSFAEMLLNRKRRNKRNKRKRCKRRKRLTAW